MIFHKKETEKIELVARPAANGDGGSHGRGEVVDLLQDVSENLGYVVAQIPVVSITPTLVQSVLYQFGQSLRLSEPLPLDLDGW